MDDLISRQAALDDLVTFILDEVWDEELWELNWRSFPEVICRKMVRLGYVKRTEEGYERLPIADPNDGGERMSKWIPTAERLPDKDGAFLVTEQAACNVKARWVKIASYAQNLQKTDPLDFKGKRHAGWFDYDSEYGHYELSDIIAWMPLEEPYKEESDGEI